ncbi:excinuclease ABC subunit UvrC [Atopobacter phocae]|uniref:excinuclease ABC subunit UvrC n=1 Tax=Atopobacter phocae TaxID=136492 RepID=UPI000471A73F|nr:excinuclease ABC subunit UvrC [Atopobacter phocae]
MPVYQNVEWINQKLDLLPTLPGCYLMRSEDETIIYIGKAKNLRNRVRSYFRAEHTGKTKRLVQEIHHFETIITQTDKEALLLEISLIQKYQPKYNIRLKDGSMYPYLKITNERDPQLVITSQVEQDGGHYFGPYPNVYAASETQQFIQKLYPLRRCGKNEPRACFYYHIGQCIGCCDHEVSPEEYKAQIRRISRFLNGEVDEVKQTLTQKMEAAAEALEFERAAEYRDQIEHIKQTVERQDILSLDYTNRDVFNYDVKRGYMSIQVFLLRQSTVIKRETAIFPLYDTPEEEFLAFILMFYQQQNHILPKEILLPHTVDQTLIEETLNVKVLQPQRGKKKRLLDLAKQNSHIALNEQLTIEDRKALRTIHASDQLADALGLPHVNVIEAFDHSHIQGAYPVSGMVVYEKGKPNKKAYRKYHIKTVKQADEFKTTQEVIRRRYSRLLKEKKPLPDLIMMDGGIIQIRAAREVIEDELGLRIPVAGMVKNDKHQTASLIFGEPLEEVLLEPNAPAFQLVQRIQEEVHRFAISFHRQTRTKSSFASDLERIEGVGTKTRMKLYQTFKTRDAMENATVDDFVALGINRPTSERLVSYFQVQRANRAIKKQIERP